MSYTIVKSASVRKAEDGTFYARIVGESNNVWPHYFKPYNCLKGHKTKEEVEIILLSDFARGGARGGLRYGKFVREVNAGVIDSPTIRRYRRYRDLWIKAFHNFVVCRDAKDEKGMKRYDRLEKFIDRRSDLILNGPDLLNEFRKWKPSKDRYTIKVLADGWVRSIGKRTFKYTHHKEYAADFPAVTAYEFRDRFAHYNPEIFLKTA